MKRPSKTKENWKKIYHELKYDPVYVKQRKARQAKYRQNHVFKEMSKTQRKQNHIDILPIEFWRMCRRQRCQCPLTGQRLTSENVSLDHIIPKSKGGTLTIENLRLVTKNANMAKYTMVDSEFVELCRSVVSWHDSRTFA